MTFDYLENVPNIAATVCDKEGIIGAVVKSD